MLQEFIDNAVMPRVRLSGGAWLTALLRPSVASFAALAQDAHISARRACTLVFAGALLSATIQSLASIESGLIQQGSVDTLLVALIPVSALLIVGSLVAFTWCTQQVARLLRGTGSYHQLLHVFATFSAPLLIVTSLLDLIPLPRLLLIVTYVYWMALYVLAVCAVDGLRIRKAIAAVVSAVLLLSTAWLTIVVLVGVWGFLLP